MLTIDIPNLGHLGLSGNFRDHPSIDIDIDIDIYFRIVFNYVVDIFYHFTENDPRAIIGKPVFMTDLSVYFYMLM